MKRKLKSFRMRDSWVIHALGCVVTSYANWGDRQLDWTFKLYKKLGGKRYGKNASNE